MADKKAAEELVAAGALDQNEKSFQKQATVFMGYKTLLTTKGKPTRWVRNVGLGFKTPVSAIKVRSTAARALPRPSASPPRARTRPVLPHRARASPRRARTSTRSAPSRATSAFVAASSRAS